MLRGSYHTWTFNSIRIYTIDSSSVYNKFVHSINCWSAANYSVTVKNLTSKYSTGTSERLAKKMLKTLNVLPRWSARTFPSSSPQKRGKKKGGGAPKNFFVKNKQPSRSLPSKLKNLRRAKYQTAPQIKDKTRFLTSLSHLLPPFFPFSAMKDLLIYLLIFHKGVII